MKKGSMTVEAAFVMPMAVMVMFLSLLLMMHVHNRSWYTACAVEALLVESTQGVQREHHLGTYSAERMSRYLYEQGMKTGRVSVRSVLNGDQVKIQVDIISLDVLLFPVWKDTIEEEITMIRPVTWIRNIQMLQAWKGE